MKECALCGSMDFDDSALCSVCMHEHLETKAVAAGMLQVVGLIPDEEGTLRRCCCGLEPGMSVSIGRGCDNDLRVYSRLASRQHARLELGEEGEVVLEDLASRNGVRCKGRRLPARSVLSVGDSFQIGDAEFWLENAKG